MLKIKDFLYQYFTSIISNEELAKYFTVAILLFALVFFLWLIKLLIRFFIINVIAKYAEKTKTKFDDILVANRVPRKIANAVPLAIAYKLVPIIFEDFVPEKSITQKIFETLGILLFLVIIQSVLRSIKDFLKTLDNFKDKPINSYAEVFSIILWTFGILSIFVTITGIPFIRFITTLGAASAVLLLIFKDTLLGFVASIQVSINDMVRIGDWITFQKYGADGDVIEINLVTVKVQNFDLTITTIPTYALISDSFQNWRGMQQSNGRRIKRAINVKQNSVKYLTDNDVLKLKKIQLITNYLETRQNDIIKHNEQNEISKEVILNGRNLTNLGVFRKYIDEYLKNHSGINKDMMIMVRQLAPTSQGIPIEIYAFSKDKRWENYEYIMADVFDHIIPSLPFFELELFELPDNKIFKNGHDLSHNSN